MSIARQILKIHPDLNADPTQGPVHFRVQDDGEGAYIAAWNTSKPKPTRAQLEAVRLEVMREERKNAVDLQNQIDLEALFGSLGEASRTIALDPDDPRVVEAKRLAQAKQAEKERIDAMDAAALRAYRTPNEKARGK